jgi:adenylate kinase
MELKTVILIGPSGCGKGTQAELLKKAIEEKDNEHPVRYLQTGEKFREFMNGDTYIQKKTKEVLGNGGLAPGFLPILLWGELFVENITGNDHIICDGFPRRAEESPILHTAFEFLEREKPTVISFELEDDVIVDRLVNGRKRFDDTEEKVRERLRWFRRDVSLAIKFFEEHRYYNVVNINGDQSVEDVHKDILTAVNL